MRKSARKADKLTLPDGECGAALVHLGSHAQRQCPDIVAKADFLQSMFHGLPRDSARAEANVGFNRTGEQEGVLQDNTELAPQFLKIEQADVHAIEEDLSALNVVETE